MQALTQSAALVSVPVVARQARQARASAVSSKRVVPVVARGQVSMKAIEEAVRKAEVPAAIRPAVAAAAANALLAAPAFAEAGKIFDFNLTLPIMAGQFLALMVVMDALVYKPVGKVLDERDADLRKKVEAVKDNSTDVAKFTDEAEGIIRAARNDAAAEVNKAKTAAEAEAAKKIAAAKAKLDAELKSALAALEAQKAASLSTLDAEVAKLSETIVKKVLPAGM